MEVKGAVAPHLEVRYHRIMSDAPATKSRNLLPIVGVVLVMVGALAVILYVEFLGTPNYEPVQSFGDKGILNIQFLSATSKLSGREVARLVTIGGAGGGKAKIMFSREIRQYQPPEGSPEYLGGPDCVLVINGELVRVCSPELFRELWSRREEFRRLSAECRANGTSEEKALEDILLRLANELGDQELKRFLANNPR